MKTEAHCQTLGRTSTNQLNFMIAKTYIIAVALIYIGLSVWCTVSPDVTSRKVGFELKGGTGQSEFMTVYGGLEFGLALVLLGTLFKPELVTYGVLSSVLIHGSLVLFRSVSFFMYSNIGSMTYKLAIGEWVILLLGVAILLAGRRM